MIGLLTTVGFLLSVLFSDGLGYADDGREIFDDHDGDIEEADLHKKSKRLSTSNKKRLNPDLRPSGSSSGSKDIRSLFAASATRQSKRVPQIYPRCK